MAVKVIDKFGTLHRVLDDVSSCRSKRIRLANDRNTTNVIMKTYRPLRFIRNILLALFVCCMLPRCSLAQTDGKSIENDGGLVLYYGRQWFIEVLLILRQEDDSVMYFVNYKSYSVVVLEGYVIYNLIRQCRLIHRYLCINIGWYRFYYLVEQLIAVLYV